MHLEAVTDELFQWLKEERAKEPQDGSHDQAAEDDGDDGESLAAQPEASLIRLVIKGRDMADFKLKVKPVSLQKPWLRRALLILKTDNDFCEDRLGLRKDTPWHWPIGVSYV